AREPEDPDAVPAARVLDYAVELGRAADALAAEDPLPSVAHTAEALADVRRPDGMAPVAPDRLPRLAAAASGTAALTSRGEVYPIGLPPRRALAEVSQMFSGLRQGLTAEQLKARVRTRYPQAAPLPDPPELDALIEAAGLPLRPSDGRYVPKTAQTFTGVSGTATRLGTRADAGLSAAERHAIDD